MTIQGLVWKHLNMRGQGKVRDTFYLRNEPELLLPIATDRISIFDFILHNYIEGKGACLTAMTIFWLTEVLQGIDHHLVAFGKNIDKFLPEKLRGNKELQSRAIVVKKLDMLPIECIVRDYLTGTGLAAYKESGAVCGISLPPGLHDGSKIPNGPIFTPTTKAEEGHDEHISADSVSGEVGNLAINIFSQISGYAEPRGIIIADSKFEFGKDLCLGDEVATPDSSRFWDRDDWLRAQENKKSPQGYDKELPRKEGRATHTPFVKNGMPIIGINNLDPLDSRHFEWVNKNFSLSEATIKETERRYRFIFEKIVGMTLEEFQAKKMDIAV